MLPFRNPIQEDTLKELIQQSESQVRAISKTMQERINFHLITASFVYLETCLHI